MREEANPPVYTQPTIFLVEEDDNARPALTNNLRKFGYRLLVAADLEDAREWMASETYIHADLVLINLVGKSPEETLEIGRRLRRHAKYDGVTPLVVMPEKVAEEVEGTDVNVSGHDWICHYEDSKQLQRLLSRLIKKVSTQGT